MRRRGGARVRDTERKGCVMSVMAVASLEGEPRAVFSALEHRWGDHAPGTGLVERTVARGPGGS
jgi:hypothetical protein